MNYIKMLEAKVAEQRLQLRDIHRRIQAFQRLLGSHKFQGQEINEISCPICRGCFSRAERKDWIATADVRAILQGIDELTADAQQGGEVEPEADGSGGRNAGTDLERNQHTVHHVPHHVQFGDTRR